MSEPICTCHCGGSMFYRHLHSDSCELSRVGEEAPMSPKKELQALRDEVARLRGLLAEIAHDCEHVGSIQHLDKAERRTWTSVANRIKAALTPQGGKGGVNGNNG